MAVTAAAKITIYISGSIDQGCSVAIADGVSVSLTPVGKGISGSGEVDWVSDGIVIPSISEVPGVVSGEYSGVGWGITVAPMTGFVGRAGAGSTTFPTSA